MRRIRNGVEHSEIARDDHYDFNFQVRPSGMLFKISCSVGVFDNHLTSSINCCVLKCCLYLIDQSTLRIFRAIVKQTNKFTQISL